MQIIKDDISGQKFGRLTAIKYSHSYHRRAYWLFKCDCGGEKICNKSDVKRGNIKSCGCYAKEKLRTTALKTFITHGMSDTKTYKVWKSMKKRCLNPTGQDKKDYKDIDICNRWLTFENFLDDMGEVPENTGSKMSIDRIDNAKGYSPENCRWATAVEQARNKSTNFRITLNGKTKTLVEWCELLNLKYNTVYMRIKRGTTYTEALELI